MPDKIPWKILDKKKFKIELFSSNLNLPVNISFISKRGSKKNDPLLYVTELYSGIKVVKNDGSHETFVKDLLNYRPDFSFPGTGESGVIGIVSNPDNNDVYVSLIYKDKDKFFNKIEKYKTNNLIEPIKKETIIEGIPAINAAHQIQALTIGPDNKLYVNIGDGMINPEVAQDDNDLRGKILRMNLDGSIPADNPIPNSFIYGKGVRNPFGADWRNSNNSLYISDNGPMYDDRIAMIEPGKNYGWPNSMRQNSIFWWEKTLGPTGIAFMQGNQFPKKYMDYIFVAMFGDTYKFGAEGKGKIIYKININLNNEVKSCEEFLKYTGDGPASIVGLAFGPDGLYFTDLFGEKGFKNKGISANIYRIIGQ